MEQTLLEYKCPSCGGALHFESNLQKMKCPYCEAEIEVEALKQLDEMIEETDEGIVWEHSPGKDWEGEDKGLHTYSCQSCGGEIIAEETTVATKCPYCDNNVVMAGNVSGTLRPDLVVPFALDKQAAVEAYKKHLKGKVLLPKIFKDENHIQEIKGVYVPVWLFDADAKGSITYRATRVRSWSDSNYVYTRTSYYHVFRKGSLSFADVPVDGSTKMDDAIMESLEPFDTKNAVDFQTAYLAGYLADKYDVSAEESVGRASQRIENSTSAAFAATVIGYSTVIPTSKHIGLVRGETNYALLPVWLMTTRYKDKNLLFAVNGQTGKFVGNLPVDWFGAAKWWAGLTAGISLLAYFIGRLVLGG